MAVTRTAFKLNVARALMRRLDSAGSSLKRAKSFLRFYPYVLSRSITPPPKNVATVKPDAPELIVSIPGIYEVQNRGKGYTSFRFESPIDGSVFSFSSFKEGKDRPSINDASVPPAGGFRQRSQNAEQGRKTGG